MKIKITILLLCIFAMSFSFMPTPGQEAEIKLTVTIPQSITLEVLAGNQQVRDTQENEALATVTLTEDNNACLIWIYCCIEKNAIADLYIEGEAQILPIGWRGSGMFYAQGIFDGGSQILATWTGPGEHDGKIIFDLSEGQELGLTFTLKIKE